MSVLNILFYQYEYTFNKYLPHIGSEIKKNANYVTLSNRAGEKDHSFRAVYIKCERRFLTIIIFVLQKRFRMIKRGPLPEILYYCFKLIANSLTAT